MASAYHKGHGMRMGATTPLFISTCLNEHNTGLLSSMKKARFVELHGEAYANSFVNYYLRFPLGGESMNDVYLRCSSWLESMIHVWMRRHHSSVSILVFSHNGVMRCLYRYLASLQDFVMKSDRDYWLTGFKNCEIVELSLDFKGKSISATSISG